MSQLFVDDLPGYIDDLLELIEEQRVVPIVGPELLTVTLDGREISLYRYVAERLVELLSIRAEDLPQSYTLNDVVAYHRLRNRDAQDIYIKVRRILKDRAFPTPEPLRALAGIRHFRLMVSTTFDPLLTRAIDEVRHGGEERTTSLSFAPNDVQDLDSEWEHRSPPTVYHLFGKVSASPTYVITEENTLDFLHALQSAEREKSPTRLFDWIGSRDLLILGCSYPDWLARFFLRTVKGKQLSDTRVRLTIADEHSHRDPALTGFLNCFSSTTRVYPGSAAAFVHHLAEAWQKRYGSTIAPDLSPAGPEANAPAMPPGAVFISYASENRQEARRLAHGLGEVTDVWLDQRVLEGGDDYDRMIRRNIRACSLFVPVLSRQSAARAEGYFRREWSWASDRVTEQAPGLPFLIPVIVDDLPNGADGIPELFWERHAARVPGGVITAAFQSEVVRKLRERQQRTSHAALV